MHANMATPHPMAGQKLGRYRIVDALGAGGMGEVYRAHDEQLERDVAIKLLPARSFTDPDARARLLREAKTASQLNHPNICTVYEVGEEHGQAYIVMELVEGQALSERLAGGGLPAGEAVHLGLQLAEALSHAHERGIVHRDFKSGNVVVTGEGRAKVLDFGLAKRLAGGDAEAMTQSLSLTQPGALVGTLAYMAPEQLRGRAADARSDIWALGAVLYETATGRLPFHGSTGYELSSAILNQKPQELPAGVPLPLRVIIERCLEKEPERRYQGAGEVRAALEAMQTGTAVSIPWRYRRTPRWWPAIPAAVVVALLALAVFDVGGLRSRLGDTAAPQIRSLAVLPLENLSGDAGQEYFADGMTDELIAQLGSLGGVRVIARGSIMRYKGTRQPLSEIARELNVQALITGTVLRSGERVRLTAELVDPASGQQMWTRRYERDLREILTLQNELTRAIAEEVQATLSPTGQAQVAARGPVDPVAFEAYLRARQSRRMTNAEDQNMAEKELRFALEKDPNFAGAHAGLGGIWVARAHMGALPPREVIQPATAAISRALELDEHNFEAHHSMGSLKVYVEWDWEAAEQHFLRAIELDPGHAESHLWYSDVLAITGQRYTALARIRRSLELDPLNHFIQTSSAGRLLRLGYRDEAMALLQRSVKGEPRMSLTRRYLWYVLHLDGRYQDAMNEVKEFFTHAGRPQVAEAMERAYKAGGYGAAIRAGADLMAQLYQSAYVQPTQIAILYACAGDKEEALKWLEVAYEDRDTWLAFLRDEPMLKDLREEPRFLALLDKMNIPH